MGGSGSLVTANNARITAFATQSVNNTAAIPLTTNNFINGTAITHVPGSTDIMLAPNQTYFATYEFQAFIPSGGVASVRMELNGVLVGGTNSRASEPLEMQ